MHTFLQSFLLVFFVFIFFKFSLLINFLLYSWIPFINLFLFIYWFPVIICLISVRYSDMAQLVPIVLQLVFLTSPILYRKESLGPLSWITDVNFIYQVLDPLRNSIIEGRINYLSSSILLIINLVGLVFTINLLNKENKKLPFLV